MVSLTWHRHIPLTHIYIIDGIFDLTLIPRTHVYIIDCILDLANTCLTSMTNMLLSLQTMPLIISIVCVKYVNRLHGKGIRYWPFTWQSYIYPDDTYDRGNREQSYVCFHFLGISIKDEELDLPSLDWIPKLHKSSYKQRCIDGSATCSTTALSKLLSLFVLEHIVFSTFVL